MAGKVSQSGHSEAIRKVWMLLIRDSAEDAEKKGISKGVDPPLIITR